MVKRCAVADARTGARWITTGAALQAMVAAAVVGVGSVSSGSAQPNDPSGIEFVTIGAVGNAPWRGDGTVGDRAVGRGDVDYEYRIGKFEVTTAQWVEFMNAVFDRPADDRIPFAAGPSLWQAGTGRPNNPGGTRFTYNSFSERLPVGGITWRTAAVYCNWLHNDKRMDRDAFLSGAYDVSTFGQSGNAFTDQLTRSPGARYFIPSWDEWLKAAHYDPNKANGDGSVGGWWLYGNGSDQAFVPGQPPSLGGVGTANFGFGNGVPGPYGIPLGSYAGVASPWGLYDVAGATAEWVEEVSADRRFRYLEGSWWGSLPAYGIADRISSEGAGGVRDQVSYYGFRIASAVPVPGTVAMVMMVCGLGAARRRR